MNETVREWLAKAEGDYITAGRELRAADGPNYDAVCFHSQQTIEKLMKGLLIQLGTTPPRTHDLVRLSEVLAGQRTDWSWPADDLRLLSGAALAFRYPGESADDAAATRAFQIAGQMRKALLTILASV